MLTQQLITVFSLLLRVKHVAELIPPVLKFQLPLIDGVYDAAVPSVLTDDYFHAWGDQRENGLEGSFQVVRAFVGEDE